VFFYALASLLTIYSVGYGDIAPVTRGGKLFATIYILVAGTVLLNNMSNISIIPLELRKRRLQRAVLTQFGDQLDDATLRELATGPLVQRLRLAVKNPTGLDECTREMFSLAMLVRLGKVSEEEIRQTFAAFRRLDVNDEGVLNSRSIIAGMIQKRRKTMAASEPVQNLPTSTLREEGNPPRNYWVSEKGTLRMVPGDHNYHFSPPDSKVDEEEEEQSSSSDEIEVLEENERSALLSSAKKNSGQQNRIFQHYSE